MSKKEMKYIFLTKINLLQHYTRNVKDKVGNGDF